MGQESILIVEDDPPIRLVLKTMLEGGGFEVHMASSADEMENVLKCRTINLITLDLQLGYEDGLALFRRIRAKHDIPVVIVTARGDDVDRIVGLELGADDYIVKPFNLREVLARVRAVLRRSKGKARPDDGAISFGEFSLSPSSRELLKTDGSTVPLTTTEFNLLSVLVCRPGHVFTRDALIDAIKGDASTAFDRAIDTLVARVRKKIEPDVDNPRYIKTIRGIGYTFTKGNITE